MEYVSSGVIIAAVLVHIFCSNGQKERLERDHPEIDVKEYWPSNFYLIILLIAAVASLIKSIFIH